MTIAFFHNQAATAAASKPDSENHPSDKSWKPHRETLLRPLIFFLLQHFQQRTNE